VGFLLAWGQAQGECCIAMSRVAAIIKSSLGREPEQITRGRKTLVGILSWIVMGLIAGALAKWIMPGDDPGGLIVTILIGVAGAFIGGFVASFLGFGAASDFSIRTLLVAIGGALVLLFGYRMLKKA
jgi:uncharacterized membrane protein YeaQ/YmgE (transglycosylase-associated protein family)